MRQRSTRYQFKEICRLRAVSLLLENARGKRSRARVTREQRSLARYSRLRRSRVTRARLLFPRGFSSKRETARSLRDMTIGYRLWTRSPFCTAHLEPLFMEKDPPEKDPPGNNSLEKEPPEENSLEKDIPELKLTGKEPCGPVKSPEESYWAIRSRVSLNKPCTLLRVL